MANTSAPADESTPCCSPATAPTVQQRQACPACAKQGKAVEVATVRAHLAISLRSVTSEVYNFCPTPDCPVVYFSPDGSQHFIIDQLREPVFQKTSTDPSALVCYCFQYTRGAVQEASTSAQAQIVADITAGVQAGQCACDIRNPQGSCCLGNIRRLAAALQRETQPSSGV